MYVERLEKSIKLKLCCPNVSSRCCVYLKHSSKKIFQIAILRLRLRLQGKTYLVKIVVVYYVASKVVSLWEAIWYWRSKHCEGVTRKMKSEVSIHSWVHSSTYPQLQKLNVMKILSDMWKDVTNIVKKSLSYVTLTSTYWIFQWNRDGLWQY